MNGHVSLSSLLLSEKVSGKVINCWRSAVEARDQNIVRHRCCWSRGSRAAAARWSKCGGIRWQCVQGCCTRTETICHRRRTLVRSCLICSRVHLCLTKDPSECNSSYENTYSRYKLSMYIFQKMYSCRFCFPSTQSAPKYPFCLRNSIWCVSVVNKKDIFPVWCTMKNLSCPFSLSLPVCLPPTVCVNQQNTHRHADYFSQTWILIHIFH